MKFINFYLENHYLDHQEVNKKLKRKLAKVKEQAKKVYEKKKSQIEKLKEKEDTGAQETNEDKGKAKLKKVIDQQCKPPMSARELIQEPIIKIYPNYNPKISRNLMRPVTVNAWETTRTMATTPFTEVRNLSPTSDIVEGFSRTSNYPLRSNQKPRTAAVKSRRNNLKKTMSVNDLLVQKPKSSMSARRSKLLSRNKSRNKYHVPLYSATYSSNCEKSSTMNPRTAKKYERRILNLKSQIGYTKLQTRDAVIQLNNERANKQYVKNLLDDLSSNIDDSLNKQLSAQKQILETYGFKKQEEFSYSKLDKEKAQEVSDKIQDSNNMIKLVESKQRIVKMIAEKSKLFKTIN